MEQPSILVVDDELLIRDLLYDFFSGQGWQISVAENGDKALEVLQSKKIDLVLTDLRMPEMDGMELTAAVRAKYPDLPVVIMTAYPSVETAVEALRQKVADYVIKPFNINQLYKTLESQLRGGE
jgi:DNA-binding NtrC family response regulator